MTTLNRPVKREVGGQVPHGIRPRLVVTLYPDRRGDLIGLREAGRRQASEVTVEVGALYTRLVVARAGQMKRLRVEHRRGHHETTPRAGCPRCQQRGGTP